MRAGSAMTPDPTGPIWPIFAKSAAEAPEAPALLAEGREIRYGEAVEIAERIAAALIAQGVGKGDFVGLLDSRSVDAILGMLGILRAGAAFVPLDPSHAPEQLPFIATDLPLTAALVADRYADRAGDILPEGLPALSLQQAIVSAPPAPGTAWPEAEAETPAYVMYTSGTTGKPKGVVVPQRGVTSFAWRQPALDMRSDDVVLHSNTIACDGSTFDIWAALLNGAACAVVEAPFPALDEIGRVMTRHKTTAAMFYAGMNHMMVDHQLPAFASCRMILSVGDVMSAPHARKLLETYPDLLLQNFYGPTEATVDSLGIRITADMLDGRPLPIGRALNHEECFVVDEDLQPLAIGSTGHLVIAGPGVAQGYWNRPEKTAEVFIEDPRAGKTGLVYLTGDLATHHPDGVFDFHGRIDRQVKLGGRRIELDGVEHVLRDQPQLAEAAVGVIAGPGGDKRIAAVLKPAGGMPADADAFVKAVLAGAGAVLHPASLPRAVKLTEDWKLTPAGKTDRKALLALFDTPAEKAKPETAPAQDLRGMIADVWQELLGLRPDDDMTFFEAGGSSIQLIEAHSRLEERLGRAFDVTLMFEAPKLGDLAMRLAALAPSEAPRQTGAKAPEDGVVAIIGMAGRFPGSASLAEFWEHVRAGDDLVTRFDPAEMEDSHTEAERRSGSYVAVRPILKDIEMFDAKFFGILPREATRMDPQHRVLLEICSEALDDAGIDPARAPGPIGVWAGSAMSTYLIGTLLAEPGAGHRFATGYQLEDLTTITGNLPGCLATRVSWKLDLKGPAMTVQTACSTALTAVIQAVGALRSGQTDVAIAGAVSITVPQKRGYMAIEGGMGSVSGVCRPFDAGADGTIFGHGAGVVVLKRLSDALAAGDEIHAVIRGTGLTNDGADKMSYTAPSVAGQAAAVAAAHRDAGVAAETISYVECHGTATPLGDPIEIAGLNRAFGAGRPGTVAIGSVKGNIGHLDVAAGIAGLIKTVQMLKAKEIAPVANFRSANPRIDFASGPFRVADRLEPWQSAGPRRAGISAFGVGGTNAHLVLEEAPEGASAGRAKTTRAPQVLPVSAASAEALADLAGALATRLEGADAPALADVAFTLQEGRRVFPHRFAVAATSAAEAAAKLRAVPATKPRTPNKAPKVIFLFPGQGSQYPGMGKGLYRSEPEFARWIDRGAEILKPLIDTDIAELLCYADVSDAAASRALKDTRLTQPALFLTEVATARLWLARGIQPDAMIGHSVGEFAAAVIAGILRFEDALRLIAARGQLMQDQPAGAMLSVRAPLAALMPHLGQGVDLAATNAPQLQVVAGPDEAIDALDARLKAADIATVRLHTSHAFHSAMMDPVVPALRARAEGLRLSAPVLPIISSVTGARMTDAEATSADYWATQARKPVNFQAALETAARAFTNENSEIGAPAFVEVGAGRTLSAFAGQTLKRGGHGGIFQSLPDHTQEGLDDETVMAAAFADLWAVGVEVDFARLDRGARKVSLPPHPFRRSRHWVDGPKTVPANAAAPAPAQNAATIAEPIVEPVTLSSDEDAMPAADRKLRLTGELLALFSDISGDALGPEEAQVPFLELGFDSLFMAQAASALGRNYGVEVSFRAMISDYPSIDALAGHLDGVLPAEAPVAAPAPVAAAAPAPAPVAATVAPAPAPMLSGDLAGVIQAQMQAMQSVFAEQLRALGGQPAAQPAAVPAPAMVRAPAPAAAPTSAPVPPPAPAIPAAAEAEPKETGFKLGRGPNVSAAVLTAEQRTFVADLARRYSTRHAKSKAHTAEFRPTHADPRTASGFHPDWKELVFPIVAERSKGAHIWDLDGNRFVDVVNGFGQTAFGHSPDFVAEAVKRQLDKGYAIGPQADLAGPMAARLAAFLGHERVTFCNTGSEAVMAAMRIARTVTGRERIVVFSNDYHGQFDEVLVRGKARGEPGALPVAPGIPRSGLANMVVLPYGAQESLDWVRANVSDIAGVIVEPVQSRHPELQPADFVRSLREITREGGAALVMDEVVTGFRTHARGMQAVWGIEADMATYGKVVGGGMPIGLLAGKGRFMDALDGGAWSYGDASKPEAAPTFFAGTFVRHPLTLAAIEAVLDHLDAKGAVLWENVPARAAALAARMNAHLESRGLPGFVTQFNGWFVINATAQDPRASLLFPLMRLEGVHILDGYCGFLTTAHDAADIEAIFTAFAKSVDALQRVGILAGNGTVLAAPVAPNAAAAPLPARVPLTESQREIWMTHQLGDKPAASFNEGLSLRLDGPLDQPALEVSLAELIARHDALRMVFDRSGESFEIRAEAAPALVFTDLSGEGEPEAGLAQIVAEEQAEPVDITGAGVLRLHLVRLGAEAHVLVMTAHHIAVDGWSFGLLVQDLAELYGAKVEGRAAKLAPAPSFAAHARQADPAPSAETLAYWRGQFAEIPALPELPSDRARPAAKSFNGATVSTRIAGELVKDVRKAGAKQGCTLFATLFAGLQVTLGRLSGARDVVLGVPSAGQMLLEDGALVGHLVNLLPIRAAFDPAEPVAAHLKRASGAVMEAFEHRAVTFGTLVRELGVPRSLNRLPLTEVQFNFERGIDPMRAGDLTLTAETNAKAAANFDMFLNVMEGPDGLTIHVDYNTDCYDAETMRRWIGHYRAVLEAIAADSSTPIAALPMHDAAALEALVEGTNASALAFDRDAMIQDLVAQGAARDPEAVAVEDEAGRMTHGELARRSDALAAHIQSALPKAGARVAVALPRGAGMLVALLAVLKAGHTYVPLDPRQPEARLKTIVETAEAAAVVAEAAPFAPALKLIRPSQAPDYGLPSTVAPDSERAAYVIFTSGSTGVPKGVAVPHRAVVNFLTSMAREPGLKAGDALLSVTTVMFDIAVLELFLPLTAGAKVVLPSSEAVRAAFPLVERLEKGDIAMMQATPTLWSMLLEAGFTPKPGLSLLAGGEPLPADLARRLTAGGATLWNMYGPTETTIWSALRRIGPEDPITIGRPIANTELHILSEAGEVQPVGAVGELNIGGEGLALGYYERPELTAAAFREVTLMGRTRRLYATGDLARRLPSGEIVVLGRKDAQVKLRGFRIELGEIEARLRALPGVDKAAVDVREKASGDRGLVAWLVPEAGVEPDIAALAEALAEALPDYMLPQSWMILPALPQTANGKLDRKALPAPEAGEAAAPPPDASAGGPTGAESEMEHQLAAIWADVLGREVPVTATLQALGADSLAVFRIAAKMLGAGLDLEARDLFAHPSVRALAAYADGREAAPKRPSLQDFKGGARRGIRRAS
ncbi:non-ribosomal peptide synthetase/type I polyketide synthase [Solirhodobacter olei]|uniref:non-ribosomal peptide synthetase/type I polyketide synthase n=1 Tax=Solirhodobacter olei TaxID=2493082 RepID=UPI000FDAEE02|nr:non-ribosomal peptide synthetase/type I polyketide synthase [Solirhodobacter olei]